MQDFRKLRVWHAAHSPTLLVYRTTRSFPRDERFGLTAQARRAAVSIEANIAEGCGRGSRADSSRCFQIALGSACELLSLAMTARDLGMMDDVTFEGLEAEAAPTRKMLVRLLQVVRASDGQPRAENRGPGTRATAIDTPR